MQENQVVAASETSDKPAYSIADLTVMIIDDSKTIRKSAETLLAREGREVLTAEDGFEALSIIAEHKPDLIFFDIMMPRMDGYELATQVKKDERLSRIPIIMITSRTGDKHRRRALEIGAKRYLGKPYNEAELLQYIQELRYEYT